MLISQHKIALSENQRAASFTDIQLFKLMLQPHFLFNSLNNLYALSVKRSEKTADAIAGLSEMLEKVVRCSSLELIPLSQELDLIRDYIRLERIWLGETNFILDFQVTGDVDRIMIPPLVLYTFVENCFKHGIRRCPGDGWLTIRVEVRDQTLYFTAQNRIQKEVDTNSEKLSDSDGFGILAARELLEKRCNGKFQLRSARKKQVYTVNLKMTGT